MADEIKYFDILVPPENIKPETYMKVYEAFCNAYNIKVDEHDKRSFSNELFQNIYLKVKYAKSSEKGKNQIHVSGRHNIRGVEYRPLVGGNKSGARLIITPLKGYARFHVVSYDKEHDNAGKFIKLASENISIKAGNISSIKTDNLESIIR